MSNPANPPAGGTPPQPPPPPPPPRPGDSVPEGGLDPTQVFGPTPPPMGGAYGQGAPAGQGQAQGAGQGPMGDDDGAAPARDSGPKPPPPGTTATKDMGYDDEDLKILAEVGNYRFGSITASLTNEGIVAPAHPETTFDEQAFLTLLRGSISLTRDEKWRIIQAIPKLSQFQIDELQKILQEERVKFSELSPKHLSQLRKLEQKHTDDWRDLLSILKQKDVKQEEQSKADEIRKQLGL